jgi:hypothetical protein
MSDTITKQLAWLSSFSGTTIVVEGQEPNTEDLAEKYRRARMREEVEEQALKEMLIDRATKALDPVKADIKKKLDMEVQAGGKTMQTLDPKGQQEKAFGLHQDKLDNSLTDKQKVESYDAMGLIVEQKNELAKVTVERSQVNKKKTDIEKKRGALFTDKEIMDELYTPLVRELVLPEDQVPKKFSNTQQMIDGSNDPYIKECKTKGGKMKNYADLIKAAGTAAASVAGAVDVAMFKDPTVIATIATGAAALLSAGVDGVSAIMAKDFTTNNWSAITGSIAAALGGALSAGMTLSGGDINLAKTVQGAVTAGMVGGGSVIGRIVEWQKNGGDFPWGDLATDLSNVVVGGLTAGIGGVGQQTTNNNRDQMTKVTEGLTALSGLVPALVKAGVTAQQQNIMDAIRAGQWAKVEAIFVTASGSLCKTAVTTIAVQSSTDIKESGLSTDDENLLKKELTNQTGKDSTAIDAETAADQAILAVQAQIEQRDIAFKKDKQEKEVKEIAAKLEKARKDFRDSLDRLGTDTPTDEDFKSIAKLIEQIETDRAKWAALIAIGQAAASVAASFFGPLAAAGELVNFIANSRALYDRVMALRTWMDAHEDAITAVSPYATSIQNFVQNQGEQASHYAIQAAANAIKIASNIAKNFDPTGAAAAVTVSVTAAASLENLVYSVYKQAALRKAWDTTKKSLQQPENRKLALIARRMNPTLAKYTIAYGALIEKSPIAIAVMNEVGLDRETLSRAGDKIPDVKKYLQTKYADDNVVLGNVPDLSKGKRKPPAPALTTVAWSASVRIWRAQDSLVTDNPPDIVRLLAQVQFFAETDNEERDLEDFPRYVESLQALALAFRGFQGVSTGGAPIDTVQKAVKTYVDLAEAEAELVDQALVERTGKQDEPKALEDA